MRHVQGCILRETSVAPIASLSITRDGREPSCPEVQPPNPLVIEIAEVQCTVGPNRHTVGVVHFALRESRIPRAYWRRYCHRCSETADCCSNNGNPHAKRNQCLHGTTLPLPAGAQ